MKHRKLSAAISGLGLVALFYTACSTPAPTEDGWPAATAEPDYWPTEGWRTSTPEEQGMDSEKLADMLDTIREHHLAIDSVLVVRNGYLVLGAYVHPFSPELRHNIHSATKSITSALIGIAIAEGYIEGVGQPVLSYFPERTIAHRDADKEALTLEHLLTMTAGFKCRDPETWNELQQSDDWVQDILDRPMVEAPGTRFEYCTEASFLSTAILQQATDAKALMFAEQFLLDPLGISDVVWSTSPGDINIGGTEMKMLPTDIAKIGFLYLHQGVWDGVQVVSSDWVKRSTRIHVRDSVWGNYGYNWYISAPNFLQRVGIADYTTVFEARGYGGQLIFIAPEKNLVVVFCSWLTSGEFPVPYELLYDGVLPAVESAEPLPANSEGLALLESHLAALARSGEPKPIPPLPEMARKVSGKTYQMDTNRFDWKTFSLEFREEDAVFRQILSGHPWTCSIGLDDVLRIRELRPGVQLACKGRWSDADTFVLNWIRIGTSSRFELTFSFAGDDVTVFLKSSAGGDPIPMTGKRQGTTPAIDASSP